MDREDDAGAIAANPTDPATVVFANAIDFFLYTSTQNGNAATADATPAIFTDLLWTTGDTLYATAEDGLYARPSGGSWAKAAEGRTTGLTATDDGKTVYAGGDGRILRSTDGGATFKEVKADQLVGTVYRLAVNPANGAELVAGTVFTSDKLSPVGVRGINILHSVDSGEHWTVLDKGLNNLDPHTLVAGNGFFLLGTGDGVYRLDTGGVVPPPTGTKGDLNGDGKVNVADATIGLQIAVGVINPTPDQLKAGDVAPAAAPDGKINVADATRILRAAVGLEQL